MNRTGKATMLSALGYPGLGQMMLGYRIMGIVLIMLTTAGIVGIMIGIFKKIPMITEMLEQELAQGGLNMIRIFEISHELVYSASYGLESFSILLVLCCWIFSVIHAIIAGDRLDDAGTHLNTD